MSRPMSKRAWWILGALVFMSGTATAVVTYRGVIFFGDGSSAGVSAANTGAIRYNNSTHVFEQSLNGGSYSTLGGGGGSTGNWTFSGNNADLTGAGAMGLGTSTATSLRLFPTTLTLTSAANLGVASQATANTTSLTVTPNVASGSSSIGLLVNGTTACTATGCALQTWQSAGSSSTQVQLSYNATTGGYALMGGNATANGIVWVSGANNMYVYDNGFTLIFATTEFAPYTDNTMELGDSSHRWTQTWSYQYDGVSVAPTFSATVAVNCTAGETQHIGTVNANVTGATMTSGNVGERCTIVWAKDATANAYTITWSGTNVRATSAEAMLTTASSLFMQNFRWDDRLSTAAWVEESSHGTP